jgi:hypothetical protein
MNIRAIGAIHATMLTSTSGGAPDLSAWMPVHASHGNYAMTDSKGTMNVRYNRPYHNVNWDYQISAPVRSIIVGVVTETGLTWCQTMPTTKVHRTCLPTRED